MSSTEFWEDDPQLYWSYRIFYLKQREVEAEDTKFNAWLCGMVNMLATSYGIQNNFSKQSAKYPTYNEMFGDGEIKNNNNNKLTKKDIDNQIQNEFNAWARY